MFYSLIRTVPCISGNITLACKLNNNTKIDRYTYISNVQSANLWPLDENSIMEADSVYNINLKFNSLEFDIPKIYQYLNDDDLFYKEYKPSDFKVSDERNKLNEFGCRRISYKKHDNFQFMFFAPIYCDKFEDLPNIFLLKIRFFNDKDEEVLSKDIHINISKETKTNYLYLYLKNYLGKLNDNVMYIAPKSEDSLEFTYKLFGIDLVNSGFSTNEYTKTHTYIENPLNYDKSICYQWKDKKIVVKQIIPLSFVFNIDDFLSNYEKLYLRNMPFKISGSYINSNSKVFDLYDFDSDYTPNYCQELLKYNYNDLVIDTKKLKYYNEDYLSDRGEYKGIGDMKKYNKEGLQRLIFENNYLDNKLSIQYFKWKLKLSSNDSPYIINENEIYTEQLADKGIQHIAKPNFTNELLISSLMDTDDPNGYNLYFPNFCSSTLKAESLPNVYEGLYYKYYDYNILYLLNILDKKAIKLNEYGYSQLRYVLNNKLLKQYIETQKEADKTLSNIEYSIDDLADELFIKFTSNDGEVYYELDSSKVEKLNINFNLKNIDYIIGEDDKSYNKVIDDINTSFINSFNYITNDFLYYRYNINIQLNSIKDDGTFPLYQNGVIQSQICPCYTIYQDNQYKSVNLVNRDDFINIFINTLDNTINVQQQLNEVLSIIEKNKNKVFYFPKIEFNEFLNKYVNIDDSKREQIINIFSYTKAPSTFNNDQNIEHSQTITSTPTETQTYTQTHTLTHTQTQNIILFEGIYFNESITKNTYEQLEKLNQSYRYLYTYFYTNICYVLKKYQEFLHLLLKSKISKKLYSVCIYQFNTNKQILNYLSIYHDISSNKVKSIRNSHLTNKSNKFTIDKISLSNAIFLFILYIYYIKDKENFTIVDDDSKKSFNEDIFDKLNKNYIFNDIKILGVNTINKANNEETNDDGKENFSNGFSKVFRKNKDIVRSLFSINNDKDLIQFIKSSFIENKKKTLADQRLTNPNIDNIAKKTVYYFYKYKKQYNKLLNKILYHTKSKYTVQKPAYKDSLKYKELVQEFVDKSILKAENSILSSMNLSYKQIQNNIDKLTDQKTYLSEV